MIVITHKNQHEIVGIYDTLHSIFPNDVMFWEPKNKPIYDLCSEHRVNLLFISANQYTYDIVEAIKEFNISVVSIGANYPENIKDNIKLLLLPLHTNISKDLPFLFLYPAANIVRYNNAIYNYRNETDILYLSDFNIPPVAIQTINRLSNTNYKIKVCGEPIPCPFYLGRISSLEEQMSLKFSAKIVLDFTNTTLYDNACNKIFTLSTRQHSIFDFFTTERQLQEKIDKYLNNEKLRRQLIKEAYNTAISNNTYFHTVIQIGKKLNQDWTTRCLKMLNRVTK